MEDVDGSIIVDTGIDDSGFKAGSERLKKAISGLNSALKTLGTSTASALKGNDASLEKAHTQYNSIEEDIKRISDEMEALAIKRIPTDDYQTACDAVDQYQKKLVTLQERQAMLKNRGVSENSSTWKNLAADIEYVTQDLEKANAEKKKIVESGNDYKLGVDTSEYAELSNRLSEAKSRAEEFGLQLSKTGSKGKSAFGLLKNGVKGVSSSLGKIGKTVAVKGFKKLGSAVKNVCSHLLGFNKKSGSTEGAIKKLTSKLTGLWGMLKRMVTRKLLQGVIQGVKDGINNLAQYSSSVNSDLSTLKSGLTQLKNSLATAFAPILSVITPILAKLLSYLSACITKIGEFFAALTGKNTFTKAVAVQEDYAASLNDTANSTDKASKANKKYGDTLDLDEVHDIQSISDSSDSSSSGTSANDMFTDTTIDSDISDFAKRIKDAIKSGDWEGAGAEIGQKLSGIVKVIDDWILNLQPKSVAMAANIANLLNGLFAGFDWNLTGKTIADGFNLITTTIVSFVDSANWASWGSSISTGLNSLVSNVDTEALGKTLTSLFKIAIETVHGFLFGDGDGAGFNFSNLGKQLGNVINSGLSNIDFKSAAEDISGILIGIIDTLTATLETIDWEAFGKDIVNFIAGIDWKGLLKSSAKLLGALAGAIISLLVTLGEEFINSVKGYFVPYITEAGGSVSEGLKNGIKAGLSNIWNWIKTNIFQPFINAFKKAFGIHSPSTVLKDMGIHIVQGFKNGIKGLATAGLNYIVNLKNSMITKFNNLKNSAITWGKDICSNLAAGIKNGLAKVGDAVKGVANKIKSLIGFSEPDEGPLSKFHTFMPDMLELMAKGIYQNEGVALDAVGSLAGDITDKLQSGDFTLSSFSFDTEIDTTLTNITDKLVNGFTDAIDKLSAIAESVTFTVPNVATSLTPYSVTAGNGRGNEQFLDELYNRLLELLTSFKFNSDGDNDKELVLTGELVMDGNKVGTLLARPVAKELNRSKIPLIVYSK